MDGYCPLAAYLGSHESCLKLALRPGLQHSARETDFNLERVIPLAQRLSAAGPKAPLLARLDSAFDSAALMARLDADPGTMWQCPRAGSLMGQRGLLGPDAPVRHAAKRRRLKTVMQELIYKASRIIEHGRKPILGLGRNDRGAQAFKRLNGELFVACG